MISPEYLHFTRIKSFSEDFSPAVLKHHCSIVFHQVSQVLPSFQDWKFRAWKCHPFLDLHSVGTVQRCPNVERWTDSTGENSQHVDFDSLFGQQKHVEKPFKAMILLSNKNLEEPPSKSWQKIPRMEPAFNKYTEMVTSLYHACIACWCHLKDNSRK